MVAVVRPRFYSQFAILFGLFVVGAFAQTYYLRFLSDLPPLTRLVHLHGLVSTAWLLLFFAQTRLVAAHRVDLHMKLGLAGVGLAAVMVVVGFLTMAVASTVPRTRPSGLSPLQFTAIPLASTVLFSVLFTLAIAVRRKRPDFHKRLMVLAMISILGPAVGRLMVQTGMSPFAPLIQPGLVIALLAWCLVHDWRRHAIVHPVFAVGGTVLLLTWPLRLWIARSEAYQPVAEWIASVGRAVGG